ncbi:carboxylesterase family protein [Rhodococcus ruber]|uniref:Carboxylic ester hydrolase n=1 Tax=Rhodococcus ruber TaxID=1830 RepID=A0ABT4MFF1_9NOCA|nr:carboxylesterase family protein [Rhodococcus ruber]MCZ4519424.1 carboxylesterase family protein [Rhodococcus ruber]
MAALRRANDNAEAFGGYPDSITVLGESAGGTSTFATSPRQRPKG